MIDARFFGKCSGRLVADTLAPRRGEEHQGPPPPVERSPASRAVVLTSGGLDSTVLLWWALQSYDQVTPVLVNWGQSTPPERKAARTIARLAGTPLHLVNLSSPDLDLRPGDFTRGHNFSLIGAAGLHVGQGSGDILIGSVRSDGHADATAKFMDDATAGLAGPTGSGKTRVLAPLLELEGKAGVLRLGLELGAPVTRSWSCNRVRRRPACGRCVSCNDRARAWDSVARDLDEEQGMSLREAMAWNERLASWDHPQPRPASGLLAQEMSAILKYRDQLQWRTGSTYEAPDGTTRFVGGVRPPQPFGSRWKWRPQPYLRVDADDGELVLFPDGRVIAQSGCEQAVIKEIARLIVDYGQQCPPQPASQSGVGHLRVKRIR